MMHQHSAGRAMRVALALIATLLASVALGGAALHAQATGVVRGRVLEREGGAPVVRARLAVVGTRLGAATDNAGAYVIQGVPPGRHTIRFTLLGFSPETTVVTVTADAEVVADFRVARGAVMLEQVVTTVTGVQRTVELGHAVGMVRADSVTKTAPVLNLSDMLTARVPGAVINVANGLTGTVSPIRLRGLNSFTLANDPLVIVDGARVEGSKGLTFAGTSTVTRTNRLGDISLHEIESIDVVKGPSAATLYGTDAANGVIVIRTKRGQAGRPRWELFGEAGTLRQDTDQYPVNYYGWGRDTRTGAIRACPLTAIASGACVQDSVSTFSPLRDPETTPIAPGSREQAGAQVSGGLARFRYLVSGAWERETGWMKMPRVEQARLEKERGSAIPNEQLRPNHLNKVNVRGNASADLGGKGEIQLSTGLIQQSFRQTSTEAFRAGYWGPGYKDPVYKGYSFNSLIGDFLSVRSGEKLHRFLSSLAGSYRPTSWLSARSTLGFDYSNLTGDGLQRTGEGPPGINRTGNRVQSVNDVAQYSFDVGGTATFSLSPALTSRTSVGAQYNRREQVITAVTGTGLPPGSETIAGAATLNAAEVHGDAIVVGSFVEQQFGWRERLFVTAAVRADGASSFGRDLRTTAYPKFSLSWVPSQEPFFPRIPGLSSLRLRAAFGASGVQPPSTAGITTLNLTNALVGGVTTSAVQRGTGTVSATNPIPSTGSTGNPGVRPERQTELEGGFDLEAWNGRVRAELTGYSRKSTDALVAAPFASSVGGGSRLVNLGSVTNRGLEGMLDVRVFDIQPVALDVVVTGSAFKNKLVSVGPDAPPGYFYTSGFVGARHKVGYPLYGGWQLPINSYADANGDGIISASEIEVGAEEVYLGPTSPTKQATLTPTLSLLQDLVRVTALFDWRGGYVRNDYTRWVGCALVLNCPGAVVRNSSFAEQAAIQAYNTKNTNYGFWDDGAFTRLREVSATVRVPRRILERAGASGGSLTLAGRNLWLWAKWPGGDPEVGGETDLQYTFPTPPVPRIFVARLNLSF